MNMIEQIKRDRDGATVEWAIEGGCIYGKEYGFTVPLFDIEGYSENEFAESDLNRIARVPDMEAALIAADELDNCADAVIQNADKVGDYEDPMVSLPLDVVKDLVKSLKAYRAATGAS